MERCCCSVSTSFYYMAKRAFRATVGIIFIAGLTSYFLNGRFKDEVACKCERIEEEVEELKKNCENKREAVTDDLVDSYNVQVNCPDGNSLEETVRLMVRQQLEIYGSDKTGLPDFALESLGGCVLTIRDTVSFMGGGKSFFGLRAAQHRSQPEEILRPDMTPGSCWAFVGHNGTVVLKLMAPIFVSHVTLEHVSPLMTPSGDISSAPRAFSLLGLVNAEEPTQSHYFGRFEYRKDGPLVQTFAVKNPASQHFQIVEIAFHENHGNALYTCVYRVRIHGRPVPLQTTQDGRKDSNFKIA